MLSPMQIQRMCTNYYVADYEVRSLNVTNAHNFFDLLYPIEPYLPRNSPGCRLTGSS